jgi:RNA polymerase sigma factor (sigma-70 family)
MLSPDDGRFDKTQDLVHAASEGSHTAWEQLLRKYSGIMRVVLHGRIPPKLRGRFDTDDVVSSGILAAYSKLSTFEYKGADSFEVWLKSIAINKLRDRIKHHSRAKRDAKRDGTISSQVDLKSTGRMRSPMEILEEAERLAETLSALSDLQPDDQEIICLRMLDGLTWDAIAEQLDTSSTQARRRFQEAFEQLVARLA